MHQTSPKSWQWPQWIASSGRRIRSLGSNGPMTSFAPVAYLARLWADLNTVGLCEKHDVHDDKKVARTKPAFLRCIPKFANNYSGCRGYRDTISVNIIQDQGQGIPKLDPLARYSPWRLQGGWHLGACCTLQWALGGYHCGHWHQREHQPRGVGSDAWLIFWIFVDVLFWYTLYI